MKNIIKQKKKNIPINNETNFDVDYITNLEPGIYLVFSTLTFRSNPSGRRVVGLVKNYISSRDYADRDADEDFINVINASQSSKTKISVCGVFEIEKRKDRIHVIAFQSSGILLSCDSSVITVVKLDK